MVITLTTYLTAIGRAVRHSHLITLGSVSIALVCPVFIMALKLVGVPHLLHTATSAEAVR